MSKKNKKKPPKKRKRIATIQMTSIPNQLRKARNYPIKKCLITENWDEKGMCDIYILREKPDYNFVLGVYLIDIWCLGLKDTFYNIDLSYQEIMDQLNRHSPDKHVPIDINPAHSIIYGSIEYAERLDFMPHSDFKYTRLILEPKEEIVFDDTIEFGQNGKPFFVAGAYDSEEKINRILQHLEVKLGKGNYHFLHPVDEL